MIGDSRLPLNPRGLQLPSPSSSSCSTPTRTPPHVIKSHYCLSNGSVHKPPREVFSFTDPWGLLPPNLKDLSLGDCSSDGADDCRDPYEEGGCYPANDEHKRCSVEPRREKYEGKASSTQSQPQIQSPQRSRGIWVPPTLFFRKWNKSRTRSARKGRHSHLVIELAISRRNVLQQRRINSACLADVAYILQHNQFINQKAMEEKQKPFLYTIWPALVRILPRMVCTRNRNREWKSLKLCARSRKRENTDERWNRGG